MNTRTVDPRTIWAVLAMEAGLALPLMSLPTQGDRVPGVLGPLLLLLLLPLGFLAVHELHDLRDPSWRLSIGIAAALTTRLVVAAVPEPGFAGVAAWLGRSFVPAAIGVALWWRGGALCVAELTAADLRTEFGVLALVLLGMLALVRPFLLPDPTLLGGSVGLFIVGGLLAVALARQDAARTASAGAARPLAAVTAVLPIGLAVALVSVLRPALLGALWTTLARMIELVLTPLGWLFAWLASLFPPGGPPASLPLIARPTPEALPSAAALGQLQDRMEWLGWVIFAIALVVAATIALIVARLLLANWIGSPTQRQELEPVDLSVERSGTPGGNAHDLFGWLMHWLRTAFGRRTSGATSGNGMPAAAAPLDAWGAYQALLAWAERRGQGRRPAETTGQLQKRLSVQSPETSGAIQEVTTAYEHERYGQISLAPAHLQRLRHALAALLGR